MLQQTTTAHAAPYFQTFRERWPTVQSLAQADWDDVAAAWAGLGYYTRARNLHACARVVCDLGGFPEDYESLLRLPGVGPYTAAAISAIAFGGRTAPVDGNIERVVSRLAAVGGTPEPSGARAARREVGRIAQVVFDHLSSDDFAGDLAQGLMDLGAGVCTPRRPQCGECPVQSECAARAQGRPEAYPVKALRAPRPTRYGAAFVVVRADGSVFVARRPPSGLLGGMYMPPTTPWRDDPASEFPGERPPGLVWRRMGEVAHVFTHFTLSLQVWRADADLVASPLGEVDGRWMLPGDALRRLPSLGRKALGQAQVFAVPEVAQRASTNSATPL
jgi:A/G-specific adenine glycosylase